METPHENAALVYLGLLVAQMLVVFLIAYYKKK
jgi:hypothetical protein